MAIATNNPHSDNSKKETEAKIKPTFSGKSNLFYQMLEKIRIIPKPKPRATTSFVRMSRKQMEEMKNSVSNAKLNKSTAKIERLIRDDFENFHIQDIAELAGFIITNDIKFERESVCAIIGKLPAEYQPGLIKLSMKNLNDAEWAAELVLRLPVGMQTEILRFAFDKGAEKTKTRILGHIDCVPENLRTSQMWGIVEDNIVLEKPGGAYVALENQICGLPLDIKAEVLRRILGNERGKGRLHEAAVLAGDMPFEMQPALIKCALGKRPDGKNSDEDMVCDAARLIGGLPVEMQPELIKCAILVAPSKAVMEVFNKLPFESQSEIANQMLCEWHDKNSMPKMAAFVKCLHESHKTPELWKNYARMVKRGIELDTPLGIQPNIGGDPDYIAAMETSIIANGLRFELPPDIQAEFKKKEYGHLRPYIDSLIYKSDEFIKIAEMLRENFDIINPSDTNYLIGFILRKGKPEAKEIAVELIHRMPVRNQGMLLKIAIETHNSSQSSRFFEMIYSLPHEFRPKFDGSGKLKLNEFRERENNAFLEKINSLPAGLRLDAIRSEILHGKNPKTKSMAMEQIRSLPVEMQAVAIRCALEMEDHPSQYWAAWHTINLPVEMRPELIVSVMKAEVSNGILKMVAGSIDEMPTGIRNRVIEEAITNCFCAKTKSPALKFVGRLPMEDQPKALGQILMFSREKDQKKELANHIEKMPLEIQRPMIVDAWKSGAIGKSAGARLFIKSIFH